MTVLCVVYTPSPHAVTGVCTFLTSLKRLLYLEDVERQPDQLTNLSSIRYFPSHFGDAAAKRHTSVFILFYDFMFFSLGGGEKKEYADTGGGGLATLFERSQYIYIFFLSRSKISHCNYFGFGVFMK